MSHEPEDRSIEACDPEGGRRSKEVLREMEMCYQKTIGTYCVRKYIYIYIHRYYLCTRYHFRMVFNIYIAK